MDARRAGSRGWSRELHVRIARLFVCSRRRSLGSPGTSGAMTHANGGEERRAPFPGIVQKASAAWAGLRIMNVQARPPNLVGPNVDQRVETPLSVLFFADQYVYKVKKPVKLDAVDFSTLTLREKACAKEVRLNQRFAGSPHLDSLPLFEHPEGWSLTAGGDPVEYCVRMKRLPADQMLNVRVYDVTQEEIGALASTLGDFYREAKTSEKIARAGFANAIETNVRSNLKALRELGAWSPKLDLLDSAMLEFLALKQSDFSDRVELGRIRDGHGDLRLEHVCLTSPPAILDSVEFVDRYRHVDVIDDVAGLLIEMDRAGAFDAGRRLWEELARRLNENVAEPLFDFYRALRAIGRAKLEAALSPSGCNRPLIESYILQAADYCKRFHRPRLLITFGLLGTGKSTLSQALANAIGMKRHSSEQVRRELFPNGSTGDRRAQYTPEARERVYQRLFELARQSLGEGASVVLDASFTTNELRARAMQMAEEMGVKPLFLECRLSKNDAIARLDQRFKKDRTNAAIRPEYYEEHLQMYEAADQLPPDRLITLTTTASVPELVDAVVEAFSSARGES